MPAIQIAPTPNPDSLKLTLEQGMFMESGMETFSSAAEAERHPLGNRLFSLPGVVNVFILPQFVTVTKHPAEEWDVLLPKIEAAIDAYLKEVEQG